MPDSFRQQLWNAIKARFSNIHVNNGYATNIGTKMFNWRDLGAMPFTADEIPGMMMRDADNTFEHSVITKHQHRLSIEVFAIADGSPPDNLARSILADLDKAIGVDRQWTINNVHLAIDTVPVSDRIDVDHGDKRLAGVRKIFSVTYRHAAFDHYTQ
jgi:hypothetical protein